ncbi:MAG: hypothetical protein WAU65_01035 [Candidatus Nanoarchaeia archaeon]
MEEKLKKARIETNRIEKENIKLMWKYAPWYFKVIIIFGSLATIGLLYKLGSLIG